MAPLTMLREDTIGETETPTVLRQQEQPASSGVFSWMRNKVAVAVGGALAWGASANNTSADVPDAKPIPFAQKVIDSDRSPNIPFPEEILYSLALRENGVVPGLATAENLKKMRDVDIKLLEDPSPVISGYAAWWAGKRHDPRALHAQYEMVRTMSGPWAKERRDWAAEALGYSSRSNPLAAEIYAKHVLPQSAFPINRRIIWAEPGLRPLDEASPEQLLIDDGLVKIYSELEHPVPKALAARVLLFRGGKADPKYVTYLIEQLNEVEPFTDEKGSLKIKPATQANVARVALQNLPPQSHLNVMEKILEYAKTGESSAMIALASQYVGAFEETSEEAKTIFKDTLKRKDNPALTFIIAERIAGNPTLNREFAKDILVVIETAPMPVKKALAHKLSFAFPLEPDTLRAIRPYLSDARLSVLDKK
jgi:hypothetical protein